MSVRELFTLLGHFWNLFENRSKTILKPCSYIELNIQNPNTIYTKHTNNVKTLSILMGKVEQQKASKCLFCIIYRLHNSYLISFVYFIICIFLYILYLLDLFFSFPYTNLLGFILLIFRIQNCLDLFYFYLFFISAT